MRFIPVASIVIFIVVLFVTLFIAEGYRYDPVSKQIVKEGIIFFEGGLDGALLSLDSRPIELGGEKQLRIAPGKHVITLRKAGFHSWKKEVVVPDEEVVKFAPMRLLATDFEEQPVTVLDNQSLWRIASVTQNGIALVNDKLHVLTYYDLDQNGSLWTADIPFTVEFKQLIPLSRDSWWGVTYRGEVFSYTVSSNRYQLFGGKTVAALAADNDKIFALDSDGALYTIDSETGNKTLFFKLTEPMSRLDRIQSSGKLLLFTVHTVNGKVAVIAKQDGSIIYQQGHIAAAFLDGERLFIATTDKNLFVYDLENRTVVSQTKLQDTVTWMSRIGQSYHFLFLTAGRVLQYCDEDGQNCNAFGKTDIDFVTVSPDYSLFMTGRDGFFIQFDFERDSLLPRLLRDLFSG